MLVYGLTIFLSAFLLFQVQPLVGKFILPWFGGGPGVWTTCMLFFQVFLLLGYAYAHFTSRWLKPRIQAVVHLLLLLAALIFLPIIPSEAWKPHGGENPTVRILGLLAATLGLPYFLLGSTAPLLQHWFSRTNPRVLPYRLYALSNTGSLLALLSYPVFFETHFTRQVQASMWGWGFFALVACCAQCVAGIWRKRPSLPVAPNQSQTVAGSGAERTEDKPSADRWLLWLLLPACASALLLAVTNKLCQDVAVVPFLWVLPLAIYLLTFIISFDSPRWYKRTPFAAALVLAFGSLCWAIFRGDHWPLARLITIYSLALFVSCMVCHGELFRLRPGARSLTAYYLMMALGGAVGGVFVAVLAPLLFTGYYELHVAVLGCALLFLWICLRERRRQQSTDDWQWLAWTFPVVALAGLNLLCALALNGIEEGSKPWVAGLWVGMWALLGTLFWRSLKKPKSGALPNALWVKAALLFTPWPLRKRVRTPQLWHNLASVWLAIGLASLVLTMWLQRERPVQRIIDSSRNFYGRLRVFEDRENEPEGHFRGLVHGRISHGWQFVDPVRAKWPTLYYSEKSGVGRAMAALPAEHRRIGVVGLGVGTLAAYARPGDYLEAYEINPQVEDKARRWFTYLKDCSGTVDVRIGDARLSLEREEPQNFDLLVLDAFNGDAIPTHLLTKEAFQLYDRHLKTNGVIAIHVSNNYLDLEPVLKNLAREADYRLAVIGAGGDPGQWWIMYSIWVILTRSEAVMDLPQIREVARPPNPALKEVPLWTDEFSSIYQIVK